jgi:hypothetical protein
MAHNAGKGVDPASRVIAAAPEAIYQTSTHTDIARGRFLELVPNTGIVITTTPAHR